METLEQLGRESFCLLRVSMLQWNHKVHPPSPVYWGDWTSNQIFEKGGGGLDRTLTFRGGLLIKRGWLFSGGGWSFHIKNKLKSEIFNNDNLGVHWKIWLLGGRGGGSRKTNIKGGLPKKEGLVSFADLRGVFGKKERGGVFEERRGVDILMHTMETTISSR